MEQISLDTVLESTETRYSEVWTHAPGPEGMLPITAEMLLTEPSGNLFGLTQNAGMGWEPGRLLDPDFLILSTHGGLRAQDGTPIALGFHSGHWEVGLLVAEAARELRNLHAVPFAGACTDPTGTGVVPEDENTLQRGDSIRVEIDGIGTLENAVAE